MFKTLSQTSPLSCCANHAHAAAGPCGSSKFSVVGRNRCHAHHQESRPHDLSPIRDHYPMLAASCRTGTIKVRQSISNNAHHGDPTRHDGYNRAKCTRSPWIHRREKRQTTRRNSRRIDRQPAFPIVSPSPRGFVLPRFVNAGRHLLAATVTPRPASKNLQESRPSLRYALRSATRIFCRSS